MLETGSLHRNGRGASAWIACVLVVALVVLSRPVAAQAAEAPTAAMMAPVNALATFMARLPAGGRATMFTAQRVTIIENFAPFIFSGTAAVARWEAGLRSHFAADALTDLRADFGAAQDFSVAGDRAYFALPTTWTGRTKGRPFEEHGVWSFVLIRDGAGWKLLGYGWGVSAYTEASR